LLSSFWAITKNSLIQAIRQPVYVLLLAAGMVLIAISPAITMFSMAEDEKLLVDMGLATILLLGAAMAVFGSSQIVTREIEDQTVGAIISKPVGRLVFIVSKFVAVGLALLMSTYLLTIMLLTTLRFGVLQRAAEQVDVPAVLGQIVPAVLAVALAIFGNYFYRWNFSSSVVGFAVLLYTISFGLMLMITPEMRFHPRWMWYFLQFERNMPQVAAAAFLVFLSVMVVGGISVAVSTRGNTVVNTVVCVGAVFVCMVAQFLLRGVSTDICQVPLVENQHVYRPRLREVLDSDWPLRSYLKDMRVDSVVETQRILVKAEDGKPATLDELGDFRTKIRVEERQIERDAVRMQLKRHREMDGVELAGRVMRQIGFEDGEHFTASEVQVWPRYPLLARFIPHLYVFWVGDQLMADVPYIPATYVVRAAIYAFAQCIALLALAAYLFEGREVV